MDNGNLIPDKRKHRQEVHSFLNAQFPIQDWIFSPPPGTGMETYFVQGQEGRFFVKVGAPVEKYLAMAEIDLTPPVLAWGHLDDGSSIMVQPFVPGRNPSRKDYREQLARVAGVVYTMHHHPRLREILPAASSENHQDTGLQALDHVREKWQCYRSQVPAAAGFVDRSLDQMAQQIDYFSTRGLVASHGDICNANWLFAHDGKIYIVDLESMSMDDPAFDIGALLWWYYAPELRQQFLDRAGYEYDDEFRHRMRVRMAIHCLSITLPRKQSFDRFDPDRYHEALEDFRAILEGRENPQGYSN